MKKMLCNAAIVIAAVLGVVSCENDLTPLGASFLGEDPASIIKQTEFDVKAYSVPVNPVQTSNFNSFPFGTYLDPIYGTSTYGFVTQVNLAFTNPNVGNNAQLLDVRIEIPYYSTATATIDEETTYRLDSLYASEPIEAVKLEVYRSNYFLNSFDNEDVTERAVYYSDFESTIQSNQGELIYENDNFFPSAEEEKVFEVIDGLVTMNVIERLSPRLRETLTPDAPSLLRWKQILFNLDSANNEIIDARAELANNNLFQDYFRGLYFKASGVTGNVNGNMIHFNLNQAKIVFKIQSDSDVVSDEDLNGDGVFDDLVPNPESEITINFNGNKVGFIENDFTPSVVADIQASNNPLLGAENLYLKGGSGSLAVIELFGQATSDASGEAPALSTVIANDWLINDAYLEFYVNRSLVTPGTKDPERILIYDYDTNRLLSDYAIGTATGLNSNLSHLGRLERIDPDFTDSTGPPRVKYRIGLTQHLSNIVAGNLENTRLAIVVSQNVSIIGSSEVLNSLNPNPESIPLSTAISHEGTVLYGNLATGNLTHNSTDILDSNGNSIPRKPILKVSYTETN